MAATKTTAVPTKEQLEIEQLKAELTATQSVLADARTRRDQLLEERNQAQTVATQRKTRITELESEVGLLREELHAITVDKARLEGYIDRAREFDQPAPAEPDTMVTVPMSVLRPPMIVRNGSRDFEIMDNYGSSKNRPAPWYKRDV